MSLDTLNPLNWWPYYCDETQRRAIPAAALHVLDADLNVWLHVPEDAASGLEDPYRRLCGVDMDLRTHETILEWGTTLEMPVPPDKLVYIQQSAFERELANLPAALQRTFDDLWAFHQAGRISRTAFDQRAADLRDLREKLLNKETRAC